MRHPRRSSTLPKLAQTVGSSSHYLAAPDCCSDCGLSAGDALNCAQDRAVWRTYATASFLQRLVSYFPLFTNVFLRQTSKCSFNSTSGLTATPLTCCEVNPCWRCAMLIVAFDSVTGWLQAGENHRSWNIRTSHISTTSQRPQLLRC